MAKHATNLDCMEEPEVGHENMAVEQDGNCKALGDAQAKEI